MIFVTVGGQMPFDRMIELVDKWAATSGRRDIFAQIGPTDLLPRHIEFVHFLEPLEFQRKLGEADTIVAHAGMGSILTALQYGKPLLVLPRRGHLHETRNDHQYATAQRMLENGRVAVALDDEEFLQRLDSLHNIPAPDAIEKSASPELLSTIQGFVS